MAALFMDSFDHYSASQILLKWDATGITPTFVTGRNGNAVKTNFLVKFLPHDCSALIMGGAWNIDALSGTYDLLYTYDYTNIGLSHGYQTKLQVKSDGSLTAVRGSFGGGTDVTLATSSPGIVHANTWHFIEMKVVFSTITGGSVVVHLDSTEVINIGSVQTSQNLSFASSVYYAGGAGSPTILFDDVYIFDTLGGVNDTIAGDHKILCLFPSADGRVDQWSFTGSAAAWQCVDENPPNSDTDYVYDSTVGHVEVFTMTDLPGTIQSVQAVQEIMFSKLDSVGGSKEMVGAIGDGATEAASSLTIRPGNDYSFWVTPYDKDPVSAAAWTVAKVNAAQVGSKVTV